MTTNAIEFTNGRLKITGDILTYQVFERQFRIGPRPHWNKPARTERPKTRIRNLQVARARLIDWVNSNHKAYRDEDGKTIHSVFLTLTFAENITDVKVANYKFLKFIQKFNYHLTGQKKSFLKYVATVEFQKRGAVHYHLIIFNLKFIEKETVAKIWGYGFIDIRDISRVKNVGFYMTKYMVKNANDERLAGRLSYLVSRGLKKRITVYNTVIVDELLKDFPEEAQSYVGRDVEVPRLGKMDSIHFNLTKYPELRLKIEEFLNKYGLR